MTISRQLAFTTRCFKSQGTCGNFCCPFHRHVLVAKYWTTELVARLVCEDGRILRVGEAGEAVPVGDEVLDVVFEVLDNYFVVVELHH